ncbi:MAG: hypothetical protein ICV66_01355 [Chitinophagaceae bacterium]|nr:hypothetical protein [Chitinophagaceae bacterium]
MKSLLLLILSFMLVFTWGYFFYLKIQGDKEKTFYSAEHTDRKPAKVQHIPDSAANLNKSKAPDTILSGRDTSAQASSAEIAEVNTLRNEIIAIFNNQANIDLDLAAKKLNELQLKVIELRKRNIQVQENENFKALTKQITLPKKTVNKKPTGTGTPKRVFPQRITTLQNLIVSGLQLSAITADGDKERQTSRADMAEKLMGSVLLQNRLHQNSDIEIFVVVLQPNGQILQTSPWDTGTFETSGERKIYSYKLRCEGGAGKPCTFSLVADSFQKGQYKMLIYHNGNLIGTTSTTLM